MQLYSNNIRVIDSMPIPVCEFGRSHFSKCFKGEASYGICASKKETYFGFKFHALTTVDGFLTEVDYSLQLYMSLLIDNIKDPKLHELSKFGEIEKIANVVFERKFYEVTEL